MPAQSFNILKNQSPSRIFRIFILYAAIALTGLNAFYTFQDYWRSSSRNKNSIFLKPGYHFADLRNHLTGVEIAGFLTDKDTSSENNDGKFLEAQAILAPTVLDLNNPNHPLIVLDCTNMVAAFDILNQLNAEPIYVNSYGKILAKRIH